MSVRYVIAKNALKVLGFKKVFRLPPEALIRKAEGLNRHRGFRIPSDHRCIYGDVSVMNGRYHCLTIQQQRARAPRAILFFFGGGMVIGPDRGDVNRAAEFGKACKMDVWFPYYPLCTQTSIVETYEMVFATYAQMVQVYGPENITILGFSSGAALGIGVCLHNNALGRPLPMPRRIIACSPGCCPDSEEQFKKMERLNSVDVMVDIAFMRCVRAIMRHGEDVPAYMLSGTLGDFRDLPEIHFWYGSDEILFACAEDFVAACRAAGVPYALHVGAGMCHCYPMATFFPEGKAACEAICAQIRED